MRATLESQRVLFILRHRDPEWIEDRLLALWEAGARVAEITLDSTDALGRISALSSRCPEGAVLGAGTVRTTEELGRAVDAGARFIVSPIATPELAEAARDRGVPSMLGAATPTEAWRAWRWGSTLVKLFPAGTPEHVRNIATPIAEVPLVAVGGVRPENARAFLDAGCRAVAMGATFFADPGPVGPRARALLDALAAAPAPGRDHRGGAG